MSLVIEKLRKEYLREDRTFCAVENVSLTVAPSDMLCIQGRSGSGKSTLLNMIAGLITPTSGHISFEGQAYSDMNDDALSLLRNTKIGFIPQGHSILPNFTVFDNICLPYYLFKRAGDPTEKAMSLLERVGIGQLARQYPARLSGGELRRVSIARALLQSPSLLLADEPTNDLDAQTTQEVMLLLRNIASEGAAVIIVTHEAEAAGYCTRRLRMEVGRLKE